MLVYVIKDDVVVPIKKWGKDNNVSISQNVSDDTLVEFGLARIVEAEQPEISSRQVLAKSKVVLLNEETGQYESQWDVIDIPDENRANLIRAKRDEALKKCDWTQIPDVPVDQEAWATYRQELRDVTEQEGFPWDVTWPSKPE